VIKLDAVKFILEGAHNVAVCFHFLVVAARVLHDLVNHELRVSPDVTVLDAGFDAGFDGDSEATEEASYSAMLLDAGKCKRTAYLMCSLRGEMKSRPARAPVFITDPSK
jgi:hypothetical protein